MSLTPRSERRQRRTDFRALKRIADFVGNVVFACALMLMAVLVFFLVQSRLAGGPPTVAGHKMYIVEGGSMEPTIRLGSIIIVRPVEANAIEVGDVVTYRDPDPASPNTIVTHRIIGINEGTALAFTTRGDANDGDDPLPLPGENVIGEVAFSVPYLGFVFSFVKTRTGILLMVVVPAVLIIATELRKLIGYAQALEDEKKGVAARNVAKGN